MAQWVKALLYKFGSINSIPATHEENRFLNVVL